MKRLGVLGLLLIAVRPALAHATEQPHSETSPIAPAVVLAGAMVLGTTLVLASRSMLDRRGAIAGGAVGLVGILVGIELLVT